MILQLQICLQITSRKCFKMFLVTKYFFTEKKNSKRTPKPSHLPFANALLVVILSFEHFTKWKYYHEKKNLPIKDKQFTLYFQGDNRVMYILHNIMVSIYTMQSFKHFPHVLRDSSNSSFCCHISAKQIHLKPGLLKLGKKDKPVFW